MKHILTFRKILFPHAGPSKAGKWNRSSIKLKLKLRQVYKALNAWALSGFGSRKSHQLCGWVQSVSLTIITHSYYETTFWRPHLRSVPDFLDIGDFCLPYTAGKSTQTPKRAFLIKFLPQHTRYWTKQESYSLPGWFDLPIGVGENPVTSFGEESGRIVPLGSFVQGHLSQT